MTSEQVDHDQSETPEQTELMDKPTFIQEETVADDHKKLTDEGWEIFDNRDAFM